MKSFRSLFVLALAACLAVSSCDRNKSEATDPMSGTTWTGNASEYFIVMSFNSGMVNFYAADDNLTRKGDISVGTYVYNDGKVNFSLTGSYLEERFKVKTGVVSGNDMQVNYDRWTRVAGMDSDKQPVSLVFKKKEDKK